MEQTKRHEYLDEVGGLLIIYMIIYHIMLLCKLEKYTYTECMLPLKFFMYWFFFKSGMFYHVKSYKILLHDGIKKLIIPYISFSFLGYIVTVSKMAFVQCDSNWIHYVLSPFKQIILTGAVEGNPPLWFLLVLFFVHFLFSLMRRHKVNLILITLIGLSTSFVLNISGFGQPYYFSSISLGLSIYTIGFLLKESQYTKTVKYISFFLYFLILISKPSFVDFNMNLLSKDGVYLLAIVYSISGCIIINNLFRRFAPCIKVLSVIGRNSMIFYVSHWIILSVCSVLFAEVFDIHGWIAFFIMLLACCFIIPIMNFFIRHQQLEWMIGKYHK